MRYIYLMVAGICMCLASVLRFLAWTVTVDRPEPNVLPGPTNPPRAISAEILSAPALSNCSHCGGRRLAASTHNCTGCGAPALN